jgi:branched-chain amino acid transport system permease protein
MDIKKKLGSYAINLAVVFAVFFILQYIMQSGLIGDYLGGIILLIGINALLAVSLNLATGIMGELCLGHAGFMAVGAYTAAIVTTNWDTANGLSFPVALIAGTVLSSIVGYLIGLPALRLHGDYLAIITLAFGQIISIVIRAIPLTGGAKGMSGIAQYTTLPYVYFLLIVAIFICYALIRSRQGRAIIAIREDEIAARACGINVTNYKLLAFVIAAGMAGLAGGLFAHYQGVLGPENFDFNYSIDIMVMVVLGGMGSITGSVLSATVLTLLPELLRGFDRYRMVIYAVVLIIMMLFRPQGLLGNKEISQDFIARLFSKKRRENV